MIAEVCFNNKTGMKKGIEMIIHDLGVDNS
jgi:hypothetical protein